MGALALLVVAGAAVAAVDDRDGDREAAGGGTEVERSKGDEFTARDQAAPAPASPSAASAGGTAGGGAASGATGEEAGAGTASAALPEVGPRIVKRAELRIEVARRGLARAISEASSIATRLGGFVAASSTSDAGDDGASGTVTVRVPADRFDQARRELAGLGKVKGEEQSGQDVTGQLVDFDARLRSLQAQEEALRTLLGRARTVGEVLEVQGRLFDVRTQIEQLQAQRAQLADAADLSTITLRAFEPGAPLLREEEPEPSNELVRAFERAWDGAVAVVAGMIVVVGYVLPLALLAGLVWGVARLRRGRLAGAPAAQ